MTNIKIDVDDLDDLISLYRKSCNELVRFSSELHDVKRWVNAELDQRAEKELRKNAQIDLLARSSQFEVLHALEDICTKLSFHLNINCGSLAKDVERQLQELSRASVSDSLSPYAQAEALLWAGPGSLLVKLVRDLLANKIGPAGSAYATPIKAPRAGLPPGLSPVELLKRVSTLENSQVEVVAVPNGQGVSRYIVFIRGVANLASGPNSALDAVQTSALKTSALSKGVVDAMKKSGVPQGAQVMLVGHSQGGIAAANLAADKSFNSAKSKNGYVHVTHVMSAGSPIDNKSIPSQTRSLSMENTRDPVPDLDGEDARPNRGHGLYHFSRGKDFDPYRAHELETSYIKEADQPRFIANPYVQKFVETANGYLENPSQPPQRFQLHSGTEPVLRQPACPASPLATPGAALTIAP